PYSCFCFRGNLSLVLGELGRTHMKFNALIKARKYFNEALIIRRAIAKKNPNKTESQKDYAIALRGFGLTLMKKEDASRAIEYFEESLLIRKRLLEKSPERIDLKRDLSVILIDLGKAKMLIEDYGNALKLIGEALSIRRGIYQLEPERLVFLKDLRLNLSKMSLCLRKSGRKVEAYEFAEEAITISERILDKSDDKQKSIIELVQRILEISELSDGLKKTSWLLKAREILENLEKQRTTYKSVRSLKAIIDAKLRS
ncbi:tetratricopeptide repeat protein, partial [Mesotoga sp.]|uniref:tetratricopeptide repeat protein n=1 Tax=Mesotoga sp. TaxID=2053577 RepID=UPI00345E070A